MDSYDKLIDLSKRRGILWNSFEIYGGTAGFFDYGPIGCIIKKQIENIWREYFTIQEGYMEIETSSVGVQDIYISSGHVNGFVDPLCECSNCHQSFRADHLLENYNVINVDPSNLNLLNQKINELNIKCPKCNSKFQDVYEFNLMFKTKIGPGIGKIGYLRPETAQGIFINFQRIANYYRNKLPFGCVQIGKSYRNEISPRQGLLRLREFTQAECEIFIDPLDKDREISRYKNIEVDLLSRENSNSIQYTIEQAMNEKIFANSYLAYFIGLTQQFLIRLGINASKLRFRQHKRDEMAHYAIDCWDAEILTERFGWIEVVGIADRSDYDLKSHASESNGNLSIYKEFNTPKTISLEEIKINTKQLGILFKEKANYINAILKSYTKEELLNKINGDYIYITEKDNVTYKIPENLVSYSKIDRKICGETIIPHVIEPSYGIDRILYCILEQSYFEEKINSKQKKDIENKRIILKLKYELTPYKASILPLIQKKELCEVAKKVYDTFIKNKILINYDEIGTIGKRYRRNDEIGIPYSITIDFQTLEDNTITIRSRDSMSQIRVQIKDINKKLKELIEMNN